MFFCQLRELGIGSGQEYKASNGELWQQLGVLLGRGKLERKGKRKGTGAGEDGEKRMEGEVEEAGDS